MAVVCGDAGRVLGLFLGRAVGAVVFGIYPEAHGGQLLSNRKAFQGGFAAQLGTGPVRDVDLESMSVYAVVFHCRSLRGDYSAGVAARGRGMGRRWRKATSPLRTGRLWVMVKSKEPLLRSGSEWR